jgi:hypothetical protein
MARIGISITKSTPFRGTAQEFSNVYYYDGLTAQPSESAAEGFIDFLVAAEKTFHGTNVTFVRGRCWSQVGTPSQNNMIKTKNLSGTGARAAVSTAMDKERAFLFRVRAGVDSRGNPVYLRKWYHACAEFVTGQNIPNGVLENTTQWTQAQRDAQVAAMNSIGQLPSNAGVLTAKSGRGIDAGATWSAHAWLEHHQLGDMWRAQ